MSSNPLYEIMKLLDDANTPGRTAFEQVQALLAENAALYKQVELASRETDLGRLHRALDEDPNRRMTMAMLRDSALDDGAPLEAQGWGWLEAHARWPLYLPKETPQPAWVWMRYMGDSNDDAWMHFCFRLPSALFAVLEDGELRTSHRRQYPTPGDALRAVVRAIHCGKWDGRGTVTRSLRGA